MDEKLISSLFELAEKYNAAKIEEAETELLNETRGSQS